MRGAIEVIGTRLPPESKDAAVVKEIVARIDALNSLMKDLLLFARPPRPRPTLVDVGTLITTTVELLSGDPTLEGIRVEVLGSAPPIMADAELLKIVFGNLLVNGAHAMQGLGLIRVSVTSVDAACHIAFSDRGPGIPPEIRDKIFTPFFTTKSRGTGLGLSTSRRLIEAHSGRIDVMRPSGGGTTVIVLLPAST